MNTTQVSASTKKKKKNLEINIGVVQEVSRESSLTEPPSAEQLAEINEPAA